MNFIIKHKWLFYLISFTWGLPMTLIGCVVSLILLISRHKVYKFGNSWYFKVGDNWGGVNLGICFICGESDDTHHLKCHESGHGVQNLFMGFLFPFLVAIPSAIRYWYRELKYYRKCKEPKTDYDNIWFEGQATKLGVKYYGHCK